MLPPNLIERKSLRAHLDGLLAEAEAANTAKTSTPAKRIKGNPAHAAPLVAHHVALIEAWLRGLTPVQRQRRYSLEEVCALAKLPGQQGEAPPAQWAVGPALRAAGFESRRDWSSAGRNRRYWQLPDMTK